MSQPPRTDRCAALALLLLAPTVAALAPAPWSTGSRHPVSPADPTGPLVAVMGALAWACTGYLLLVLVVTTGSHLPGAAGRALQRTSRRMAPAAVRSVLRLAVGLTAAGTALGVAAPSYAAPSHAAPSPGPAVLSSAAAAAGFDWPTPAPSPAGPLGGPALGTAAPTTAPTAAPTTAPPAAGAAAGPSAVPTTGAPGGPEAGTVPTALPAAVPTAVSAPGTGAGRPGVPVVVRAGDSLWAIAARALGPQATPARVAQAWPQWWHANRDVLGDEPDLIHPGTRLAPPTR